MHVFRKMSLERRSEILGSLYIHPLSSPRSLECESSSDDAGLFPVDIQQFSSELLVTVNRLSNDEADVDVVSFSQV